MKRYFLVAGGLVLSVFCACSGGASQKADAADGSDGHGGEDGAADAADLNDTDACRNVVCHTPPQNHCRDDQVLVVYDSSGVCRPETGECVYPASEVECPYGCRQGRCADLPADRVVIYVPPGTRICKSFAWDGDSVWHTWTSKFRITLRPGHHLLPFLQDGFDYDWIEKVEVATAGEVVSPAGGGRFTREWLGPPGESRFSLRFRQRFSGKQPPDYGLDLEFFFEARAGAVTNPVLALDERNLTRGPRVAGTFTREYSSSQLMSCSTELLEERRREFRMHNGDVLRVRSRGWIEPFGFPQQNDTYIGGLQEAYFSRGAFQVTVTDYFDLASGINHHGYGYSYWIHLDQPLGNVTDLVIDEFSRGQNLIYQDGEGNIVDQQPWTEAP